MAGRWPIVNECDEEGRGGILVIGVNLLYVNRHQ